MNRTALLLLLGAAALVVQASCNYERMTDQESLRRYETQMPEAPVGAVPADGGEIQYRLSPEGSLSNPVPATPESIERGRVCYGYYCVHCHGTRYNGDGTVGQSFHPLPADLMSPEVQRASDDDLFRSISYGRDRVPPLAYTVAVEDRWHLINWIRSLGVRRDLHESIPSGDFDRR